MHTLPLVGLSKQNTGPLTEHAGFLLDISSSE
jgi:hypothetical protein